jgi:hypothetical protein
VNYHPYSYDSTRRVDLSKMYEGNKPNTIYNLDNNSSDSTKLGLVDGGPSDSVIRAHCTANGGRRPEYVITKVPSIKRII